MDVAADILGCLKEQADKQNIHNIQTVVSREGDPMLPDSSIDLAFFCDTTHHIANLIKDFQFLPRQYFLLFEKK